MHSSEQPISLRWAPDFGRPQRRRPQTMAATTAKPEEPRGCGMSTSVNLAGGDEERQGLRAPEGQRATGAIRGGARGREGWRHTSNREGRRSSSTSTAKQEDQRMNRTKMRAGGLAGWAAVAWTAVAWGGLFDTWGKRMQVRFQGYTRGETLTHFPALVVLSTNIAGFNYADFLSPPSQDLRFTSADGLTELPYEVDEWDTNSVSFVWVQVPQLQNTNTYIWAYWRRAGVTAPAYTTNGATWSNGYQAVWHMKEASNTPRDSAMRPNDHSGIDGGTDGVVTNSRIGRGLHYQNAGRVFIANSNDLANLSQATASFWYYKRGMGGGNWGSFFVGAGGSHGIRHTGNDWLNYYYNGTAYYPTPSLANEAWHFVTYAIATGSQIRVMINGEVTTQSATTLKWIDPQTLIGRSGGDDRAPYGILDEMRLSSVMRSTNWIWAEFMTSGSNALFTAYGEVESQGGGTPVIQNELATNVTASSAFLNATLQDDGGLPTQVWVLWDTNDWGMQLGAWAYTNDFGTNAAPVPVFYSFEATGLTPLTTYFYTYYVRNAFTGAWGGAAVQFKTQGPPAVNNNGGATNVTAASANLRGEVTAGDPTPAVYVCWGLVDAGTGDTGAWQNVVFSGVQSGVFTQSVSGLQPTTTYYYACFATNLWGGAWAPSATNFTTPLGTPVVDNVAGATEVRATRATLWGAVTEGSPWPEVYVCWGLSVGGENTSAWDRVEALGPTFGAFSCVVTGLLPRTPYYYRCYATNLYGADWADDTQSFTTDTNVTWWLGTSGTNWLVGANWSDGFPQHDRVGVVTAGKVAWAGGNLPNATNATVRIDVGGTVNVFNAWNGNISNHWILNGGTLLQPVGRHNLRGNMEVWRDSLYQYATDPSGIENVFSGTISGTGRLNFVQTSGGMDLLLAATADNSGHSGGMDIRGRVRPNHAQSLGTGDVVIHPNGRVLLGITHTRPFTLAGGALVCDNSRFSYGPLTLTADSTVDCLWADDTLIISGPISGGFRLIKGTGPGIVDLRTNSPAWSGGCVVLGGRRLTFVVPGAQGTGPIVLSSTLPWPTNAVANFNAKNSWDDDQDWSVTNDVSGHGVVRIEVGTNSVRTLTLVDSRITPGGTGAVGTLIFDGMLRLAGAATNSTVVMDIFGASNHDRIVCRGQALHLNGQRLAVNLAYDPAPSDELFIIENRGTNMTAGTFAGLPEGATLDLGRYRARISYTGSVDGVLANDVKLYGFVRQQTGSLFILY